MPTIAATEPIFSIEPCALINKWQGSFRHYIGPLYVHPKHTREVSNFGFHHIPDQPDPGTIHQDVQLLYSG